MMQDVKHVFEGTLRGFKKEPRKGRNGGSDYEVDVMVLDDEMNTIEIVCKRVDADSLRQTDKKGTAMSVEVILRGFDGGIGVTYSKVLSPVK